MPLEIQSPAPDIHVAALVGVLDSAAGQEMVASTKQTVRGRNESIVLDCTRLRQMDMGGFRGLLSLLRWAEANEARVIIAGMSPDIWQMIVDNHCGDRFESRPSVPAALQSLGLGAGPGPQAPPAGSYQDYPEVDPYGAPPPAPAYGAAPARDPWAEMNAAPPVRGAAAPGPWDQPAAGSPGGGGYTQPANDPWSQPAAAPAAHDPWAQPAAAAADPWAQPAASPAHDPWAQPASPATAQGGGDWGAQPAWGGGGSGTDDAWADYERQAGGFPATQRPKAAAVPAWRKPLTLIIAASVVLALVLAWFLIGWMKVPVITLDSERVDVELGSYPSISIKVENGKLDVDACRSALDSLGLAIVPPETEDAEPHYYSINGGLKNLDKATKEKMVELVAFRGSRRASKSLTVVLKAKEVSWPQRDREVAISAGVALPASDPRYQVTGNVTSASATWDKPSGLGIQENGKKPGQWFLSGTAANQGSYLMTVKVTDQAGNDAVGTVKVNVTAPIVWPTQTSIDLTVGRPVTSMEIAANAVLKRAEWNPSSPPPPLKIVEDSPTRKLLLDGTPQAAASYSLRVWATAGPGAVEEYKDFQVRIAEASSSSTGSTVGSGSAPPTPPPPDIDPTMRDMLLNLIDRAPAHFKEDEKDKLRLVVSKLTDARRVAIVYFDNGSSSLTDSRRAELRRNLEEEATKALLQDHDCQVFVVGYASTTGSLATNIRLSKQRAAAVNQEIRKSRGQGAELCGDYGPTDALDNDEAGNRAVAIYAGKLDLSNPLERQQAEEFKNYFNREHGLRD